MYQANEAAEDGHALKLAILAIVLGIVGIILSVHSDTAIKYWLLGNFGATAQGTVVAVHRPETAQDILLRAEAIKRNRRNALKNFETWVFGDAVAVAFRDKSGTAHRVGFLLPRRLDGEPVSETFTIAYLPQRPGIAYPLEYLNDFNFDARVTFWSAVVGLIVLVWMASAIRQWRRFRKKMKSY